MHKFSPASFVVMIFLAGCAAPAPEITAQPIIPSPTLVETETPPLPPPMMVYPDIPYTQIDGVDPNLLSLDIYAPLSGSGPFPVVVMVHGGSWREGDKRTQAVAGDKSVFFTSRSCIFVSVNYRLAPQAKYPAPVQDLAAAIQWIHTYIGHYGGDAGRVYLIGHSAGGQITALAATDEKYLTALGLGLNVLRGVILLDGAGIDIPSELNQDTQPMFEGAFGNDPEVWRQASPINHIESGKDIPPFLIFYAGQDSKGQSSEAELANALTAAGVKNWLVSAPDRTHATILVDVGTPGDPVTARIMDFIQQTLP